MLMVALDEWKIVWNSYIFPNIHIVWFSYIKFNCFFCIGGIEVCIRIEMCIFSLHDSLYTIIEVCIFLIVYYIGFMFYKNFEISLQLSAQHCTFTIWSPHLSRFCIILAISPPLIPSFFSVFNISLLFLKNSFNIVC